MTRHTAENTSAQAPTRWAVARRWLKRLAIFTLAVILLLAVVVGAYEYWFYHRSQPAALSEQLMPGVFYQCAVTRTPRPMVIHVVTVDLKTPGLSFVVTPPDPIDGHELRAKTTSEFLKEAGCQIAINGGYFQLCKTGWWRDYPRTGDPVDVIGLAASDGVRYSPAKGYFETLFMSRDNQVSLGKPIGAIYNAISGSEIIVKDSKNITHNRREPEPVTAVGLDATRSKLILLVIDGKQPGYSEGATVYETADLLLAYGAADGMFFDGGGSSTLVVEGKEGEPRILNVPVNLGIVGLERPVGDQLGIRIGR